jgi:hypothetical protein
METLLEQQRRYHEERERLMDGMVQERLYSKANHRDGINSEHRQRAMLERYDECTHSLREIYEDKDGGRKEEVAALSGPNEFAEFYARLKQIKDFHRRHPGEVSVPMSVEFDELKKIRESPGDEANNMVEFSDEEGYGEDLLLLLNKMIRFQIWGCNERWQLEPLIIRKLAVYRQSISRQVPGPARGLHNVHQPEGRGQDGLHQLHHQL